MARFYARFDSGSESQLDSAYFEKRRISTGASAGADLRSGLIASRSAVSADIYAELDAVNRDGQLGIYFVPDVGAVLTTDSSTYLSWSNAYTSSFDGIKIPTTNAYGAGAINFSKRPTASVTSTNTMVGPLSPVDSASVSYNVYLSASNAVTTVLNSIQDGAAAAQTPYTREGNIPSRTLHSIWNDPDLNYFAWDDFTPGQPQTFAILRQVSDIDEFTSSITLRITASHQYMNDGEGSASIYILLTSSGDSLGGVGSPFVGQGGNSNGELNVTVAKSQLTSPSPSSSGYTWAFNIVEANPGTNDNGAVAEIFNWSWGDPIITTSFGTIGSPDLTRTGPGINQGASDGFSNVAWFHIGNN